MDMDLNSNPENTTQRNTDPLAPANENPGLQAHQSIFRDLLSRRVPQILGGYLAGSWIIFEFVQWLVSHYTISPHLEEFCLIALASLIPTVFLLAYFHGKPGRDKWTRVEKIGIPTNLVATAFLLIFLFRGRDLGATTTSVSLTDETGHLIERVIPKSEFRKKVAIFSLDNETGDTTFGWMMHAIPDMIKLDLIQDMYLDIKSIYDLYEAVRDEGFPDAAGIPLILKKKIAEQQYMEYFIAGSILQLDDQLSVIVTLHETRTTKALAEKNFTGNKILEIVDEISIWVKEALSLPVQHLDSTVDLPASEIMTNSSQALKTFYCGMNECYINENWEKGLILLEQSVQVDTTFAYGYEKVFVINLHNTSTEEGMQALEALMKHLYKLPERMQFELKQYYYYFVKKDPDLARKVIENWIELYPEDVNAHGYLAEEYMWRNQRDEAVAEYKKILNLDPARYEHLLDIAQIYKYKGEFNEALNYYRLYANEFRNNSKPFTELGNLYTYYGKHEQARSFYEKAMLIEPDEISILLLLAKNKTERGEFNSALNDYAEILEKSYTPQEKVKVYKSLQDYYFLRGQVNKAIDYLELGLAEKEKYDTRFEILRTRSYSLVRYIVAGKTNVAFQYAREIENLGSPFDGMILQTYLDIYLELEHAEGIEEYLEKYEAYCEAMEIEISRAWSSWARGKLHETKEEYEAAIQHYLQSIELYPISPSWRFHIGRCYRMNKEYKKAEEHFQKIIDLHPFWPEELYEFGLVYAEWGKHAKALEYIRRANSIWENADTTYALAMRARQKLAELEALTR